MLTWAKRVVVNSEYIFLQIGFASELDMDVSES